MGLTEFPKDTCPTPIHSGLCQPLVSPHEPPGLSPALGSRVRTQRPEGLGLWLALDAAEMLGRGRVGSATCLLAVRRGTEAQSVQVISPRSPTVSGSRLRQSLPHHLPRRSGPRGWRQKGQAGRSPRPFSPQPSSMGHLGLPWGRCRPAGPQLNHLSWPRCSLLRGEERDSDAESGTALSQASGDSLTAVSHSRGSKG